jgi:excisionase family DNA binding protein
LIDDLCPNEVVSIMAHRAHVADTESAAARELVQLYESIAKGGAKLLSATGEAQPLPDSLHSFLTELTGLLNQRKPVYLIQDQAKLTTIEAAAMIGVSRQFLINLLEKNEIPYHMVGTHRRIYAQDLVQYKAKRDENRSKILSDLAKAEADEGLYDRLPSPDED